MITLIVAIEVVVSHQDAFTTDQAADWKHKGWAASALAKWHPVLCFGDSLIEIDAQPRVLERMLGHPVFNLAVPAGSPESSLVLLQRVIRSRGKPKAIIVDYPPFQLVEDPVFAGVRQRLWPEMASAYETVELSIARRDPIFAASTLLASALPSCRSRDQIRASIRSIFTHEETWRKFVSLLVHRHNGWVNHGAIMLPSGSRHGPDSNADSKSLRETVFNPIKIAYLDRFLRLAASHSIPVYWLIPPISPEYQASCDQSGGAAVYDELVRSKHDKYRNVIVIDGRHSGYDPTLFNDSIHLNRRGSAALSEDLGILLSRPQPPSRWITLNHYRNRPLSPDLEDVSQSRTAIGLDEVIRH